MIDLRSDTLTRPTPEMRRAMYEAEVGDDTFQEDPTVNELEAATAEILGTEAALYVPSGTMSNQVCLMIHGKAGDAVIAHQRAHIFEYESGAPSGLSSLTPWLIESQDGTFSPEDIEALLKPPNIHHPRPRIVSLENTHNRSGGTVWSHARFIGVCSYARKNGMAVHLDGARLWNAVISSGVPEHEWIRHVDSTNVCFSKALGAPVGSALAGSRAFVEEARFYRKMFGGQMRQAGIIAAGALYALRHNRARLVEDHANAQVLAEAVSGVEGLRCRTPDSNIVVIEVSRRSVSAEQVVAAVEKEGVLLFPIGATQMRAVTNMQLSQEDCLAAADAFGRAMQNLA